MRERNGVGIGQLVRDLDGTPLGKVVRLYDWGFQARRGLWSRSIVVRYDEVRGVRDGALVVARSSRDVFDLAAGELPPSWRIPAPPEFPTAATPSEASNLREDLARGRVGGAGAPPEPAAAAPMTDEELRRYVDTRGEAFAPGSQRIH